MPQKTGRFYAFGPFQLDPSERALFSGGSRIPLTPKAFETLLVLVEKSGHIIEKDELLTLVWPDTFVEEGTLAQNVSTLRKALGDGKEGQTYIETIPRRGYRFVARVEEVTQGKPEASGAEIAPPSAPPVQAGRSSWASWTSWAVSAVVALTVVSAILGVYFVRRHFLRPHNVPAAPATLAVLPFQNLSSEPEQQYFADGFTEEMIAQLGSLDPKRLGIIGRVSTMKYQGEAPDARQIGRELGADYILRGSVTRAGDRVRITAQLIETRNQKTLWTKDYERQLRDILSVQSEVAGAIAGEIELKLKPQESARLSAARTVDPDAYEMYLKGRYFWNQRTEAAYGKAIEYFNQAVARDPRYALAYSGLADAYALLGSLPNATLPRRQAMPRAKAAALTALQLDDSIAEAHASLAFVEMHYEWNWGASREEFERAVELNPNYATAHQWFALWQLAQGHPDESLEEIHRARKADPLSVIIRTDTVDLLNMTGKFDEAIEAAHEAMDLNPSFQLIHSSLGTAYLGKGLYPQAIAELQKGIAMDPSDEWSRTNLGCVYASMGERAKAEQILRQLLQDSRKRTNLALGIATVYSALANKTQAFAWLERAYQNREGGLILINVPIGFRPLRDDPRFADLVRRVGLSPSPTVQRNGTP